MALLGGAKGPASSWVSGLPDVQNLQTHGKPQRWEGWNRSERVVTVLGGRARTDSDCSQSRVWARRTSTTSVERQMY